MKKNSLKFFGFLPIPIIILSIAVLNAAATPFVFYDPAWLIPITNTLFVTVVCFAVAWIALKNYGATGRIQVLLLGCGVLVFGIGGAIAGFVRGVPDGANLNVTIYNTGALVSALFHFVASMILVTGVSPEAGAGRKQVWLTAGYLGVILFTAVLSMLCFLGVIPPFFIQGQGPTLLRQVVLGCADILFTFSFLIFMATYIRNRESFLYWYSLALALTSISLTAFFVQRSVGSPVGWAGRVSQYMGGIYFLVSLLTAIRSAAARKTTLDNVVTASLSPVEEKFRALAENSPDIIDRYDRELRHTYVNQAFLRLHGKAAHAIIGKTIRQTGMPDKYRELWEKRIQQVFDTGLNMEMEDYFPADDGLRFFQSRCVPEFGVDGSVTNVLVISRDLTERKKAEDALKESEARYRNLFENMAEEVHFWKLVRDDDGRIKTWRMVNANPPALKSWNKTLDDIVGKTADEIFGPGATEHYLPVIEKILAGGVPYSFEDYFPNLDRYFRFTSVPFGEYFITTGADITGIKRAEKALLRYNTELEQRVAEQAAEIHCGYDAIRAERQRFLDVLETLPVIVVLLQPDYRVVWGNRAYREALGDNVGKFCYESQFGFDEPCQECQAFTPLRSGQPHNWERTLPNGRMFDIHNFPFEDSDGSPLILGMDLDITERRQADEALKLANAYNRSLIEASLDPLVTIGHDGRIMDVNSATESATGLTRGELIGTDFCEYFSEPDKARKGYEQVFRESTVRDYPLELRHRDGHVTSVVYNAAVYRDARGEVIGIFAAARDITQRKLAEEALRELNATLEQRVNERTAELSASEEMLKASLHEKEVLLKEIHHRVKNNMQVISSLVSLQADGSNDETVREVLRDVTYRVRSMSLVHEKLYQSHGLASIDFAEYAGSLLSFLWRSHGAAASSIRLNLDLQPVTLTVDIAVPCGLILNELAGNTLKHAYAGRDGGDVAVSLRKTADARICLSVRDDGVGLPPGLDWRRTTSLGLQLVQMLSKQLSALVEVETGKGTEFRVVFSQSDTEKGGQ